MLGERLRSITSGENNLGIILEEPPILSPVELDAFVTHITPLLLAASKEAVYQRTVDIFGIIQEWTDQYPKDPSCEARLRQTTWGPFGHSPGRTEIFSERVSRWYHSIMTKIDSLKDPVKPNAYAKTNQMFLLFLDRICDKFRQLNNGVQACVSDQTTTEHQPVPTKARCIHTSTRLVGITFTWHTSQSPELQLAIRISDERRQAYMESLREVARLQEAEVARLQEVAKPQAKLQDSKEPQLKKGKH